MRTERDMLGERTLGDDTLYGLQTLRAFENFGTTFPRTNLSLIYAMVQVKKAAAMSYQQIAAKEERLQKESPLWSAVISACDRILSGDADEAFITSALQGGAGTSTNMNVNEVIANLALSILEKPCGSYDIIHPLDDVNRGQSTNDVYPTALRIASIQKLRRLSDACAALQESLQKKELEFEHVKKLGRTEMMDAMDITQNQDVFVEVSGLLKSLAVNLMKIASDLRLMASGPSGGLHEITLPALQRGSTIMPGKVNPVIPEMITQTAIRVIANDTSITMAASNGNFELNAFLPLIAESLLESLDILTEGIDIFRTKCIDGIVANEAHCQKVLETSAIHIYHEAETKGYDIAEQHYYEKKENL